MQSHFIQINNLNLHYKERRPSVSKGCLIFLHGFPEYWGSWQAQLAFFSDEYRVIAPDLLGYNLSEKPSDPKHYEVPALIDLMAKFVEQVSEGEPVILVAHDWGGAIAWPLVAFHSAIFSKLIILNAAHPSTFTREMINNSEQRQKSAYIHQIIAPDGEALLRRNNFEFLREMLFEQIQGMELSHAWRQAYLDAWSVTGAVDGMLNYYRLMPQLAPVNEAAVTEHGPVTSAVKIKIPNIRIDLPTLVLWGEQDKAFVSSILDGLEQYVPNCQVKRYPTASHWLHHEQADEVNKAMLNFIEVG